VPDALRERLSRGELDGLTGEEREVLAIALMLSRNKVTHIYELINAAGATRQVVYDRQARVWQRRAAIASKHAYESAVDPFGDQIVRGEAHAPLLYAGDPRTDLPAHLQDRVVEAIRDRDAAYVAGWFTATGR
jgi:hypothetical protein